MSKDRHTDLFPWILGLGLLAAGAFGAVLIMAPPAPKTLRVAAAAPELLTPAPPPPPMQVPLKAPSLTALASVPDGAPPALANNPIWQCEVNGQKIFADSPCGAGASIRALNETNRMNPTPIAPRSVYSSYPAAYEPPYTEPYSEDVQNLPGNTVYVGRPVYGHRMPPRLPRGHHPELRGTLRAHGM
jgi:hypothetical protein